MYKLMGVDTAKWYVRNYEKYMKKQVEVSDVQLDLWEQAFAFIGETIAGERIVSVSGSRLYLSCIYLLDNNKASLFCVLSCPL